MSISVEGYDLSLWLRMWVVNIYLEAWSMSRIVETRPKSIIPFRFSRQEDDHGYSQDPT